MARSTTTATAKVWKTAAYIRLSREDGDKTESESITNQRQLIGDYIASQPDLGGYTEFIDDGATGTNFNRQGFQHMLEEIKNGSINCVVVKDLSRFGRNYTEAGTYIEQVFPLFGIRFIAINDHIDSYTRPSEMESILVPLKNLLNDSYSRDLSVKVKSAMTAKRKRGEFIGAFAAYGYLRDPEDGAKLIVDGEAAPIVRNMFEWYANGMSKSGIVRKLNELHILSPAKYRISKYPPKKKFNREYNQRLDGLWTMQGVTCILKNPVYCGHMSQGKRAFVSYKNAKQVRLPKESWIIAENTHEPIVDGHTFDRVQELLHLNTRESPKTGQVYLFSGFLKCADCGRTMDRSTTRQKSGKVSVRYRCSTHFRRSKEACTRHTIPEQELEEAVFRTVKAHIAATLDADAMLRRVDGAKRRAEEMGTVDRQLASRRRELEDTESIKLGLYTDLKKGIITQDEYIALKSGYTEQIRRLAVSVEALEAEREHLNNQEALQGELMERFRKYRNIDGLTRGLVVELIDKIYIHEGRKITIRFQFQDEFQKIMELAEQERKEKSA